MKCVLLGIMEITCYPWPPVIPAIILRITKSILILKTVVLHTQLLLLILVEAEMGLILQELSYM